MRRWDVLGAAATGGAVLFNGAAAARGAAFEVGGTVPELDASDCVRGGFCGIAFSGDGGSETLVVDEDVAAVAGLDVNDGYGAEVPWSRPLRD